MFIAINLILIQMQLSSSHNNVPKYFYIDILLELFINFLLKNEMKNYYMICFYVITYTCAF